MAVGDYVVAAEKTGACLHSRMSAMARSFADHGGGRAGAAMGIARAFLRVVAGQPDLADALADLAGIDIGGGGVKAIANSVRQQIGPYAHEFSAVSRADRDAAEEQLLELLMAAAEAARAPGGRDALDLALGMGSEHVVAHLRHFELPVSQGPWEEVGGNEYFVELVTVAARSLCEWSRSESSTRERATLQLVRQMVTEAGPLGPEMRGMADSLNHAIRLLERSEAQARVKERRPRFVVLADEADDLHHQRAIWIEQVLVTLDGLVAREQLVRTDQPISPSADRRPDAATILVPWRPSLGELPDGVIPVVFGEDQSCTAREAIRVGRADPVRDVLDQLHVLGALTESSTGQAGPRFEMDPTSSLPRLRRLSDEAARAAATIGRSSFAPAPDMPGPLYVRRNLQRDIVGALRPGQLILIEGAAGDGKTSLLWGVAREVADMVGPSSVFFVPAGHLTSVSGNRPLVSPEALVAAVAEQRIHGDRPVVLVDTADLLVNDVVSLTTLRGTLDDLTRCGASVVVTSRPQESQRIVSEGSKLLALGPYSTEAPEGELSEFERAVAGHGVTYCRSPGDATVLATQVRQAVIRDNDLGELARKPLFLRMLFELYAPGTIPDDVEPTVLFERFWADRVVADRREWGLRPPQVDDGEDLSIAAVLLAKEMLRAGRPEVDPRDVPANPGAAPRFEATVRLLLERGVGRVSPSGGFSFFHQSFFEFVAALALLESDAGLVAAIERLARHPEDMFLGAVVEQTLMCAWRLPNRRSAAERWTAGALSDPGTPDILQRIGARVAAANASAPAVERALSDVFHSGDISLVKEYLRRRPRPGRAWEEADAAWLNALRPRDRRYWFAAMDPLARAVRTDPDAATASVARALDGVVPSFPDNTDLGNDAVQQFMLAIGQEDPEAVAKWIASAAPGSSQPRHANGTAALAILLGLPGSASASAAAVADLWPTGAAGTQEQHAQLHRKWLGCVEPGQRPALVAKATGYLAEISDDSPRRANHAAFLWGLCLALDDWSDPNWDTAVFDLLLQQSSPRVHEHVHDGWLAPLANRSEQVRERLAQLLTGLPVGKNRVSDGAARWTDTARRLLNHRLLDRAALSAILEALAQLDPVHGLRLESWLDPDRLLFALLRCAVGDVPPAVAALDHLHAMSRDAATRQEAARLIRLALRAEPITKADPGALHVLEVLADLDCLVPVETFLKFQPQTDWTRTTREAVRAGINRALSGGDKGAKATAARILQAAVSAGRLPLPATPELLQMLDGAVDGDEVSPLAAMASDGVLLGEYDRDAVISWLRKRLSTLATSNEHTALGLRQRLLVLGALAPGALSVDELVDLAFEGVVQGDTVHCLTGVIVPDRDGVQRWPLDDRVRLVIEVGTKLATYPHVSNRARKDTAGRWRQPLFHLLNGLDAEHTLEFVAALPLIDHSLAEVIAGRAVAYDTEASRRARQQVIADPRISAETRRQLTFAQQRSFTASGGWWTLYEDLRE